MVMTKMQFMADKNDFYVFGFSVRISLDNLRELWVNEERRKIHLLDGDVIYPLSIDEQVWPLDYENNLSEVYLKLNSDISFFLDLSVCALKDDLFSPAIVSSNESVFVAFCAEKVVLEKLLGKKYEILKGDFLKLDELFSAGWGFHGFDVSDSIGYSSLSNCGMASYDQVKPFIRHINKWGLLNDYTIANDYRKLSDQYVSNHGGFYVFGLLTGKIKN
jgi:hypothetical protein